jgi:hypothetical protein
MKINPQKDKRHILRLVREAGGIVRILKKFDLENCIEISTPSGRYCRNKAVIDFFREAGGVTTKVLESGSHGHYEVVTDAQSVSELADLVEKYWLESHDADKLLIGQSFFEERITQARKKSDEWTHSMIPGLLPALNNEKKLCVFYTTTQIEFEGTGDPQKPDEFENQVEAIKFLRMKLPISEWDLVVRRHPRRVDVNHLDRDLLEGIEKIENVIVVDGDSKVDSYALGNVADLIFHFGSTIGAEFTFLSKVPVYALKLTFWWKFSKDHHLCKKNQLENLDLKKLAIADPASVLPWGYYLKRGGGTI